MSRRNNTIAQKYTISAPRPVVDDSDFSPSYARSPSYPEHPVRSDARNDRHLPDPSLSPARPARAPGRAPSQSLRDGASRDFAGPSRRPADTTDPFAYDRSQRSELRAQASAPAPVAPSGDKLRSAVGAFMSAGRAEPQRPTKNRARQAKREQWDFADGDGKYAEIDGVLRRIRQSWPFVLESDFSPSTLALSLLSEADGGSRSPLRAFLKAHDELSMALQTAVQSHFQSFAASLPAHAMFLTTLERAQEQAKSSKKALREAREGFAGKGKGELAGVKAREKTIRDMLGLLDVIDALRKVPDQLEGLIGEKRYLEAAVMLVRNSKTCHRADLVEVGALADLRAYFKAQETTLADIVVEELQNHVYLKAYASDTRWQADPDGNSIPTNGDPFQSYLATLANKPLLDPTERPKSVVPSRDGTESFDIMASLLETLNILTKLESSVEALVQRTPGELHSLIDGTLDEVEERAQQRREADADQAAQDSSIDRPGQATDLRFSLDTLGRTPEMATLRDLFWTLYSKLNAVVEGYRILYEVCRWIVARRDLRSSNTKGFDVPILDLWRPLQQEIRQLLQNYLSEELPGSNASRPVAAVNEVLRGGNVRDRQKAVFKFLDTDSRNVTKEGRVIDDKVQETLMEFAPGLINVQVSADTDVFDDQFTSRGNHRNLISASPFNVSTLFHPTLVFIERACATIPPEFDEEPRSIGGVLEEFVVKVFLPRLDDQVTIAFQNAISGHDASELDVATSGKPPQRSSVQVLDLIHSLCAMLETTPFHRENYSRLIVGVIVQFYQQCSTQFKDTVTVDPNGKDKLALPANWAQREDFSACLADMRKTPDQAIHREIKLETELLGTQPLVETQLLASPRRLERLASLAQSLRWFIEALLDLNESEESRITDVLAERRPRLPLTQAMAQRFEAIVQTYEQLADMVVNTVRLELRARLICNLGAFLREGEFWLESEAFDPDPDVVELCRSMARGFEIINRVLDAEDASFSVRGLGSLADHLFVTFAGRLGSVNSAGVKKIQRNVQALQQTLRSAAATDQEGLLTKSLAYWDLYESGPKAMLDGVRSGKPVHTFEDYNTMLNLQCKSAADHAPSTELNTYLIDLHALSMEWE